jgi:hypothetical protein
VSHPLNEQLDILSAMLDAYLEFMWAHRVVARPVAHGEGAAIRMQTDPPGRHTILPVEDIDEFTNNQAFVDYFAAILERGVIALYHLDQEALNGSDANADRGARFT